MQKETTYYYHSEWNVIMEQIMPHLYTDKLCFRIYRPGYPWEKDSTVIDVLILPKTDPTLIKLDNV